MLNPKGNKLIKSILIHLVFSFGKMMMWWLVFLCEGTYTHTHTHRHLAHAHKQPFFLQTAQQPHFNNFSR